MAIYSFQCKIIGRGQSKSSGGISLRTSVAAAAYRAGERLRNLADGKLYDFTRKQGVVHTEILLPKGAPARYRNRQTLWNEVEATEKRCDAQLSREFMIALPTELTYEQNIGLARSFIQRQFVDRGMCADVCFHDPEPKHGHPRNPHLHVMVTMRDIETGCFRHKNREWNKKELLEDWRELWAVSCNEYLSRSGFSEKIDHRSYKAQGMEQLPTVHLGVQVTALENKGVRTDKGNINRSIRAHNAALECGVRSETFAAELGKLWHRAAKQRRVSESAAADIPDAAAQQLAKDSADICCGNVQRRTYTSQSDVVRQGRDPAPIQDEKRRPPGEVGGEERPPRRGQEAKPSSEALRQPAQSSASKPSLTQRLVAWLAGSGRQPAMNLGNAVYDIKVMSSMLEFLKENGINSYADLERHIRVLSDNIAEVDAKLLQVKRAAGTVKSCMTSMEECAQLRQLLAEAKRLHGAALRCQANRRYAEEYAVKVLFKENYYKKYADKINAFEKASAELKDAGLADTIAPAQLGQLEESLRKQLRGSHQKLLWMVKKLNEAGCSVAVNRAQLEILLEDLFAQQQTLRQQLSEQRRHLWKWQRVQSQLDNVLENKVAKEPPQRTAKERKKIT